MRRLVQVRQAGDCGGRGSAGGRKGDATVIIAVYFAYSRFTTRPGAFLPVPHYDDRVLLLRSIGLRGPCCCHAIYPGIPDTIIRRLPDRDGFVQSEEVDQSVNGHWLVRRDIEERMRRASFVFVNDGNGSRQIERTRQETPEEMTMMIKAVGESVMGGSNKPFDWKDVDVTVKIKPWPFGGYD